MLFFPFPKLGVSPIPFPPLYPALNSPHFHQCYTLNSLFLPSSGTRGSTGAGCCHLLFLTLFPQSHLPFLLISTIFYHHSLQLSFCAASQASSWLQLLLPFLEDVWDSEASSLERWSFGWNQDWFAQGSSRFPQPPNQALPFVPIPEVPKGHSSSVLCL